MVFVDVDIKERIFGVFSGSLSKPSANICSPRERYHYAREEMSDNIQRLNPQAGIDAINTKKNSITSLQMQNKRIL